MDGRMSNIVSTEHRPRVLFFGMLGNFSYPALAALLERNIEVCAVILPASPVPGTESPALQRREPSRSARLALPLLTTSHHVSIAHLAWSRNIAVWEVYRLSDATTLATLAAYKPDVLCVACFSQRIPRAVLTLPRLGCLNVHPSLLPANRGPVPLFWTFRNGEATAGVTTHMMDEEMDSGDILAQEAIPVSTGMSYNALEALCAARGGALLAQTVWKLSQGNAERVVQDELKSSYHSFPTPEDFIVPVLEWDAQRVYNFIRGVGHWNAPIELRISHEQSLLVRDCISYSHKIIEHYIPSVSDDTVLVPCHSGHVLVKKLS